MPGNWNSCQTYYIVQLVSSFLAPSARLWTMYWMTVFALDRFSSDSSDRVSRCGPQHLLITHKPGELIQLCVETLWTLFLSKPVHPPSFGRWFNQICPKLQSEEVLSTALMVESLYSVQPASLSKRENWTAASWPTCCRKKVSQWLTNSEQSQELLESRFVWQMCRIQIQSRAWIAMPQLS